VRASRWGLRLQDPGPRASFALFAASIVAVVACGARTGLPIPQPPEERSDAGLDAEDAGPDVEDASDAPPDVFDAPPDVFDAPPDVFDAPVDAPPDVIVPLSDCQDAGVTFIYLISEENELLAFYPPENSIHTIGTIQCPDTGMPYSMAVDRKGIAYVVFTPSGNLYRVSTLTASCETTPYKSMNFGPQQPTFGMGFSADTSDPGETLYIASDDIDNVTPEMLGTIDETTFQRSTVGSFSHSIGSAELTGTGDGKLYGFGVDTTAPFTLRVDQIDKANAAILDETFLSLPGGNSGLDAWAFAYWGGDFYFFTATGGEPTQISRYHPGDAPVLVPVMMTPGLLIDGAGVSTCAPQQ
jgi:hypothetical protein